MITPNFWPVVYMKTRVKTNTMNPQTRTHHGGALRGHQGGMWWDSCVNRLRDMTVYLSLSIKQPGARMQGPWETLTPRPSHRAVHLLSLSSHVKTVHKIFMDQGASVSELMILWAATGEAPLDLSGEHRDPCDHQIISFIGEEDFTELQWRKI